MVRVRAKKIIKSKTEFYDRTKSVSSSKLIPIQGRQMEIDEILTKCNLAIKQKSKLSLYISGQPGQGKTLSVNHSVQKLLKKNNRTHLKYISVNGMKTKKAEQIFVHIWREITSSKSRISHKTALERLEDWLSQANRPFLLILLDEIDGLLNSSQSTIYHIFEWVQRYDRIILISISNTFDLPEKVFKQKIVSRVGHERIDFNPYKADELVEIAKTHIVRSSDAVEKSGSLIIQNVTFEKQALRLCASKVASITADARKMLNICEIIIHMAKDEKVTKIDVRYAHKSLSNIFSQPCDQFLRSSISLNPLYKIALSKIMDACDIKGSLEYKDIVQQFWDVYAEHSRPLQDECVIRQYFTTLLNSNVLQAVDKSYTEHYSKSQYRWNGSLTFLLK
eukprot:NODE_429_length_7612_cov_0.787968.p2 type:complete len:393 gc:universal NODE_429_length_7612_cov_0.787968:609-1787(+)